MDVGTILIVLLVLLLVAVIPVWSFSRPWGYGPGSLVGLLLAILVILALLGRI